MPGVGMHLLTLYNDSGPGPRVTAVTLLKYNLHTVSAQSLTFLPKYC